MTYSKNTQDHMSAKMPNMTTPTPVKVPIILCQVGKGPPPSPKTADKNWKREGDRRSEIEERQVVDVVFEWV